MGESNAKLTPEERREIKDRLDDGETATDLADEYDVSDTRVSQLKDELLREKEEAREFFQSEDSGVTREDFREAFEFFEVPGADGDALSKKLRRTLKLLEVEGGLNDPESAHAILMDEGEFDERWAEAVVRRAHDLPNERYGSGPDPDTSARDTPRYGSRFGEDREYERSGPAPERDRPARDRPRMRRESGDDSDDDWLDRLTQMQEAGLIDLGDDDGDDAEEMAETVAEALEGPLSQMSQMQQQMMQMVQKQQQDDDGLSEAELEARLKEKELEMLKERLERAEKQSGADPETAKVNRAYDFGERQLDAVTEAVEQLPEKTAQSVNDALLPLIDRFFPKAGESAAGMLYQSPGQMQQNWQQMQGQSQSDAPGGASETDAPETETPTGTIHDERPASDDDTEESDAEEEDGPDAIPASKIMGGESDTGDHAQERAEEVAERLGV